MKNEKMVALNPKTHQLIQNHQRRAHSKPSKFKSQTPSVSMNKRIHKGQTLTKQTAKDKLEKRLNFQEDYFKLLKSRINQIKSNRDDDIQAWKERDIRLVGAYDNFSAEELVLRQSSVAHQPTNFFPLRLVTFILKVYRISRKNKRRPQTQIGIKSDARPIFSGQMHVTNFRNTAKLSKGN